MSRELIARIMKINITKRRAVTKVMAELVGLIIVVIVASALVGTLITNVNSVTTGASPLLSGPGNSLYSLIPFAFALGVFAVAIGFGLNYLSKHIKAYRHTITLPNF